MARFIHHVLPAGPVANRPAAATVPEGAMYPAEDERIVYRNTGVAWEPWLVYTVGATTAGAVTFTPVGTIAATDVQAAIAELDTEITGRIDTAITALINASPATLDTLGEIATALGNDPNFATTITNLLAQKTDAEQVRDLIGTTLVQGANVTLTVNDVGDTVTIDAAGGGTAAVRALNAQTGTAYTLAATDAGPDKMLTLDNAGAVTVTVPPDSTVAIPVGSTVSLMRKGSGSVSVAAGVGVTIRKASATATLDGQWAVAELLKIATDEWVLYGRLAEA